MLAIGHWALRRALGIGYDRFLPYGRSALCAICPMPHAINVRAQLPAAVISPLSICAVTFLSCGI